MRLYEIQMDESVMKKYACLLSVGLGILFLH